MSDHESTYVPKTAIERWMDTRLPIIRFGADYMSLPTPKNLNYWYTFGAILALCLVVQIASGIFLAMQYPVEVPGVSMTNFLRTAKTEVDGKAPAIRTWTKELSEAMKRLKMDPKFATRSVNEGFSGGEKKRAEVLQLELLKPKFAILDETDSGLDVDALRIVSEGVNRAKEANQFGILMVTHYTRILRYIKPDIVHVFADGHFIKTGGPELADELEETGYDAYLPEGSDSESALA